MVPLSEEDIVTTEQLDLSAYEDAEALEEEYKDIVLTAIKKSEERSK